MPGRALPAGRWENWPLLAGAICMLGAVGLFIADAAIGRQAAVEAAERETRLQAAIMAEHAARTLESAKLALDGAVEVHDDLINGEIDDARAHLRLRGLIGQAPVMRAISVTDRSGWIVANSAMPGRSEVRADDRPYFIRHRADADQGALISPTVTSRGSGAELVIPLTRRLEDASGAFDGVAIGILPVSYFMDFYRRNDFGLSRSISLSLEDGTILLRDPDNERFAGQKIPGSDQARRNFLESGVSSKTMHAASPFNQERRILTLHRVEGHQLILMVGVSYDEVVGRWFSGAYIKGLLLMLFCIAAMAAAWMIHVRIVAEKAYRRELETAKAAAERANRSKSSFLANMSHELRTPLNAIIGFSDLLKSGVYGRVNNRQQEAMEDIAQAGRHLLQLINTLLDLSKIEAGGMVLRLEPVDLAEVVEEALRLCRPLADDAKVELNCNLEVQPPLLGDRQALYQVTVNLLSNAVKFTPPGGRVDVVLVRAVQGVLLTVRDTGIGIAPDDLPRVVEPYAQADSHIARKHKGTGLGLPLAKQLVELHEASLTLTSEVNAGTTVSILFPAKRFATPAVESPAAAASAANG